MKIVINGCYGGFSLSQACADKLGVDTHPLWDGEGIRTNPALIEEVEKDTNFASGICARLRTVTIPDEATDYEIDEYDGCERITYVLNGKLYHV